MIDVELYKKLDLLILAGNAGPLKSLAEKLGIEPRSVKYMLMFMKTRYRCPIEYSLMETSYYYTESGQCLLGFQDSKVVEILKELEILKKRLELLSKK